VLIGKLNRFGRIRQDLLERSRRIDLV
jgi:hypothetical protein